MNRSNRTIASALPIYGQHLAEATGIKVVIGGDRAYTNGQQVNVPMVKDGDAKLAFGFIAHECSHVRNTDMRVFGSTAGTPIRQKLLNILEDVRIERLSMDQYPGTEDDIRYLNRKVLLEPFSPNRMGTTPTEILHGALLFGTYWKLQEPQLETPAKAYLAALAGLVGQPLADQIMAVACRCLDCSNTEEVLGLVDEILALLPDDQQQQQQQQQQQPEDSPEESGAEAGDGESGESDAAEGSSEQEAGDQSQGAGQNSSSGDQPGEDDAQNTGGAQAPAGADQDSASQSQQGQDQTRWLTDEDSSEDLRPTGIRSQVLSSTEADLAGLISDIGDEAARMIEAEADANGTEEVLQCVDVRKPGKSSEFQRIRLGLEQSAGLRQVMSGLLQSQVDVRVRLKRQGRRLDASRIAMLKAGEGRVFRSKARAVKEASAIQILLDNSLSMDGHLDHAEAALYAVLKALEGLPLLSVGAMAFPFQTLHGDRCQLIKAHTETLQAAVNKGGFGLQAEGSTPLAGALWAAAGELFQRRTHTASRKVLFVITDGMPNRNVEDPGYTRRMVERCEASGITVIGLGFGAATEPVLRETFNHYCCVGTVENLRQSLFGLVREVLAA